ncbi:ABC transporter ATP-binding protein [Cellulomonas wangsupingiae]|uniref:ATP-binding cassette domain-containing protein n=1 Tax=Cellulomonas wangsupingiae TaxID=2968085 RepID=A0ABY5K4F6_9CELL|nr:ATP-binding cassette domain-containing protein [Cellulomonas wangsupingiae]MCC2336140.1 ATP-binding cassette domain-containing protein [Cellulomonas wangsupingiae]MCM0639549.1 ATP-binding cassette domain-containing protein [Cellulomonas wangsupingiae]UUI64860.1 ATP-binding cassette domain-containing protein [Cellulomonas wangsupingiae]
MIQADGLTKRYGDKTVVDAMTFTVQPGKVTGFLGPNGAGKSTTMRMIVGLDHPSSGRVIVNGRPYAQHRAPLGEVGVLLDAKAVHGGRPAREHLLAQALTHGIGRRRVDEVIELTGLGPVARKRAGQFSLGMGQRLGIAAALLGDPQTLILDEPVNGLDPEGVLWVRTLLRGLAAEGRTVFLSSHLMSEMALTADHLIVIGRGRVVADAPVADVVALAGPPLVRVRTPDVRRLAALLATAPGVELTSTGPDLLDISGATAPQVAAAAASAGVVLHELAPVQASLEDAYLQLTGDDVEYRSTTAGPRTRNTAGAPR